MVYHGIILKYRNINHTVCILFSSKCVLCVYVVMTVTHSNNLEKMFAMCQNTQTRLVGLTGKEERKVPRTHLREHIQAKRQRKPC